jgi:hypothetical protein
MERQSFEMKGCLSIYHPTVKIETASSRVETVTTIIPGIHQPM